MNNGQTCLGPYIFQSATLGGIGPIWVDNSKTRQVTVITDCGSPHNPPSDDAVLIHEELNCSKGSCDIRWYECPSETGRTYSIFASGCGVLITSFENGLLSINECDSSSFGSEFFCFGKIYSDGTEHKASTTCYTSFTFDGHHFTVNANQSQDFGLFDCGPCWDQEMETFAASNSQDPPDPTPPANSTSDTSDESDQGLDDATDIGNTIEGEDRSIWHNVPSGDNDTGLDVNCTSATSIPRPDVCSSHDNPAIAILRSGQAIIAYEDRDESGLTKISLALFKSTVGNSVKYHRSLSKGVLVNNPQLSNGQFKFYDDILIDEDIDEEPDESLKIGFITGPLRAGQPFTVISVTRLELDNGRVEHTITFNLAGRSPDFSDSNNASDVEWFLVRDVDTFPVSTLTLPEHLDQDGKPVSAVNPSISVAENNLGRDTDQNVFIAYQALENNQWNVYLRHIMISDKSQEAPSYQDNYVFLSPTVTPSPVVVDFTQLEYHVVDIASTAGKFCGLFEARLPSTGEPLINETPSEGGVTESCGMLYDSQKVYIEAVFDTNTCGFNVPNWIPGSTVFTGGIPPTAAELGWSGDTSCLTFNRYPNSVTNWLYGKTYCTQTSLFEDPYCPSPYVTITYKPEELYNLKVGNDVVTRVIYHLDANIPTLGNSESSNEVVDFMFLIDHSASMSNEINSVRQGVTSFAHNLAEIGADFRFGFTIYARGSAAGGPGGIGAINPINCGCTNLNGWMFDALDFPGSDAVNGFTDNVITLDTALSTWGITAGYARPFIAIQFALQDVRFQWRENAKKFIFLVTDALQECPESGVCYGYSPSADAAIAAANAVNATIICAVTPIQVFEDLYLPLSEQTGWTQGLFPVQGSINSDGEITYEATLDIIISTLSKVFTVGLSVLERDELGYNSTFLNRAKVLVTYDRDLSDLWTQQKNNLRFTDNAPILIGTTKGLVDYPFDLYPGQIYGVDPVHLLGNLDHWIYFDSPGQLKLSFPSLGVPPNGISQPRLIANNATRPRVAVNNRNDVFVAYESFEFGNSQIAIKGTGDFAQSSITGAKGARITRFVSDDDLSFNHTITLPEEGVNQICDLVVDRNDVVHVTWQSSRDKYWEIYYANGIDLFEPVRITRSNSRSGAPRIDVDKNGSIFIVYHDNRFGPYDIMMSYKEEHRVLPLLQQDPYLASLSALYKHYTNLLPVTISNVGTKIPLPGVLVGTKTSEGLGNSQENFIFRIENGEPLSGGDTDPWSIRAIACSPDGYLYGVTEADAYGIRTLLQVDEPEPENSDIDVETDEIQTLGEINLGDSVIVDMTHDYQERLWLLVVDLIEGSPDAMRIINISTTDGDIVSETTIFSNVDQTKGAIAAKSDGSFWVTAYQNGYTNIYTSVYPTISGSITIFDFNLVTNTPAINPIAFTTDDNDVLFALDDLGVYIVNNDGSSEFQFTINDGSSEPDPYLGPFPIGEMAGFAYQFSGRTRTVGDSGYFNLLIEFYNNINLEGDPSVIIDSRTNLDAFLSPQDIGDPYLEDAYFLSARGVYLESGQSKTVIFDASLSRPDTDRLAYPYGFARNQTYFPKAFLIDYNGNITEIKSIQTRSFSCNKCDQINTNSPDVHACSYSFIVTNSTSTDRTYNFQVDFFADQTKRAIMRRFNIIAGDADLQYVEVNNKSAIGEWSPTGLVVKANDSKLVQVYPALVAGTDFLCGINYFVRVQSCDNTGELICSNFEQSESVIVNSDNFFCECSSTIMENPINYLGNVGRWISSGQGYSDTRVTDSIGDSLRPAIKTRSTDGAIILFEDYNEDVKGKVLGASFNESTIDQIFGSGTKSWFDYDLNIRGRDVDVDVDFYDRSMSTYESPDTIAGKGLSKEEVPGNNVYFKSCDFDPPTISEETESSGPGVVCDFETLEDTVVARDNFLEPQLVQKGIVHPNFVDYFTYNASGSLTSVVSTCNIKLQIWLRPEVVAIRLRNEGSTTFSDWCPVTPEISEYYVERSWKLSAGSGIKEVCVQAMTYAGITTQFCVPIVADYERSVFELNIYSDDQYSQQLPLYDGLFVAATKLDNSGDPKQTEVVYIEIIPNIDVEDSRINFDVIQQGANDQFDLPANRATDSNGRTVFRGPITIYREDKVFNIDGLARIRVKIPGACDENTFISAENQFIRDRYNLMSVDSEAAKQEITGDPLEQYRQSITGKVGVNIVIRPTEDPYFIFGDPDYFVRENIQSQPGVKQQDEN